jgi:hypothetical protein
MRSSGKAAVGVWAILVLNLGPIAWPTTARAQFGGFGGGLGGLIGGGGGGGGMGRGGGLPGLGGLLGGGGMSSGSPWQNGAIRGNGGNYPGYGPMNNSAGPGYYNNNGMVNSPGYYNNGTANPGYYNGAPAAPAAPRYAPATAPASSPGQPYLATDGKYYYPDGRPYTPPARTAAAAAPAPAPTPPPQATPAQNILPPEFDGPGTVPNNTVRTRLAAAPASAEENVARELGRSLDEALDQLERSLGDAVFREADETSFLAIYKRSFTEDTSQYRLARNNIKYLDAAELRQGLETDGILDAGVQIYPAKLEVSAALGALRRGVQDGQSAAEVDRLARGLLKTYEGVSRMREFEGRNIATVEELRGAVDSIRQRFEVRQRLADASGREAMPGRSITMGSRFRLVRDPALPRGTVQAIDPELCLWGTGAGRLQIQDADLPELGVPLLNPGASPVVETPRGGTAAASTGVLVQNPLVNKVKVSYVIDGVSYDLKPGESRAHAITSKSQITYNRGGTLGNASYSLTAGTYRFAIQARSWQVNKTSFNVVVDNSANGCDFQCEIDGQPRRIAAHKTLPLSSNYPITIRFDRGHDQGTASKSLGDTRVVTVGVAPDTTALDLFPGPSQELAVRPPSAAVETIASQATPAAAVPPRSGPPASGGTPAGPGHQSLLPTIEDLQ